MDNEMQDDGTFEENSDQSDSEDSTRRGVIRWWVRETMGVVFVGLTLFLSAGTLAWFWGWALVALYGIWVAANGLILGVRSPELLAERANRRADAKKWDLAIMSVVGVLSLVKYVVGGLDFRFGWSAGITPALQFAALAVAVGGYALGTWAMAVNAYFSLVVRIQRDRGQIVVSDGPYRWVRHPGYVGTVLFELATPLLLGSWWALVPGVISALLLVVRTALEDRTLQEELDGYKQYAGEVRYRLLPGVW